MSLCVCPICGAEKRQLTKHVNMKHHLTKEKFLEIYPGTKMISEETSEAISDSLRENWKDPNIAQRYSSYWRSEEHGKEVSERLKKDWKENPDKYKIPFQEYARSPEGREVRSRNMKKVSDSLWKDEEYVEKKRVQGRDQMLKNLKDPSFGYCRNKCYYNGVYYRSSWEVKFAKFCDDNTIKFKYESFKFDYEYEGHLHYYVPDFYLIEYNIFIEIKPSCKINLLTDIKIASVRDKGFEIYYITDCSDSGLNSQLVPLLRNR